MKRFFTGSFLLVFLTFFYSPRSFSQSYSSQKNHGHKKPVNFNGQWRGGFDEGGFHVPGMNDNVQYVLELNTEGSSVSGYSYTYFQEGMNRYYTICRLTGSLDRENNDVVVTEIERVKFNTPPGFQNCFQTHRLHYERDTGNTEVLRGTWITAPGQQGGCGSGITVLSRKVVTNMPTAYMPRKRNTNPSKVPEKKAEPKNQTATIHHPKPKVHKLPAPEAPGEPTHKNEVSKVDGVKSLVPKNNLADTETFREKIHSVPTPKGFAIRRKDIVKVISLENPTFKVQFYDNGVVDGDSISVFYNGRVVLSHQMLSEKPITLELTLDDNVGENIVTMYADNLGSIPPNTALMVVTDGKKRYEVRMESDTEKSGSVVFKSGK